MKNYIIAILFLTGIFSCTDFEIEDQGFQLQTAPGYVSFGDTSGTTADAANVNEGANGAFRIYAPTGILSDVTVTYSVGGTATLGTDYTIAGLTGTTGTLTIPYDGRLANGNRDVNDFPYATITVAALNDAQSDADETVILTITSASNAEGEIAIGRGGTDIQKSFTATIKNVDLSVRLEVTSASLIESDETMTPLAFTSNFPAPADVTISLAAQGDAAYSDDFTYLSGNSTLPASVVLKAGESRVVVDTLVIVNDDLVEAKDSVIFALTAASIAGTGNIVKVGTADTLLYKVADDMKVITMKRIQTDTLVVNSINQLGNNVFTVQMENPSGQTISIDYTITGGAAGTDYTDVTGGTVTFEPGQTEAKITIAMLSDAIGTAGVKKINVKLDAGSLATGGDTEVAVMPDDEANNAFNIKAIGTP